MDSIKSIEASRAATHARVLANVLQLTASEFCLRMANVDLVHDEMRLNLLRDRKANKTARQRKAASYVGRGQR